mgnify:CR=1 FL=1
MIAKKPELFYENMLLMDFIGQVLPGDFIECGTWRGGMSCAMMAVGGNNRLEAYPTFFNRLLR